MRPHSICLLLDLTWSIYAVPVWDPHCSNHVQTLERVQKFALKMCYKAWKDDYDSLHTRSGLQSLNERRKYLKLCYLYQIIHGHFSCTTAPVYRDLKRQLRNSSQHHLYQPYARTSSYQLSFFPHTISLWNSLPFAAHSCHSLQTFKKCLLQLPLK